MKNTGAHLFFDVGGNSYSLSIQSQSALAYFKSTYFTLPKRQFQTALYIQEDTDAYHLSVQPEKISLYIKNKKIPLRGLDYCLKGLIALDLLRFKYLLFHASAILKNGNAYIFLGDSGSGKTTILHSVPPASRLADDIVLLSQKNNIFYLVSNPFEKDRGTIRTDSKIPLSRIFILKQSKRTKMNFKPTGWILAQILSQNPIATAGFLEKKSSKNYKIVYNKREHTIMIKTFYPLLLSLMSHIPAVQLEFTKKMEFLKDL